MLIKHLFDFFYAFATAPERAQSIIVLEGFRSDVLKTVIGIEAVFLGLTFLMSLLVSHRVAGPLYKLKSHFDKIRGGKFEPDLRFRKHDHFKDLADAYNDSMKSLKDIMEKRTQTLGSSISKLEQAAGQADSKVKREIEDALKGLKEVRDQMV